MRSSVTADLTLDLSSTASAAPSDGPDPFDPARFRLNPSASLMAVKRVIAHVQVRKPGKQEFVRVRPEPEFRLDTGLLELKDDREFYLVDPLLGDELAGEISCATLFAAVNRSGMLFLWPVKLPNPDGRRNSWAESARRGAELATKQWLRLTANVSAGEYELFVAAAALPDPEWPDLTMRDLLKLAFRDMYIDSLDHPAVRRLQGLV